MREVWRIQLDRYALESAAKSPSGLVYSLVETVDLLIEQYEQKNPKPIIEVVCVGMGMVVADILDDKKIPCIKLKWVTIRRIGSADILISRR